MDAFKKYIQSNGTILYWPYNKSQYTCSQAQDALNALLAAKTTDAQRLTLFVTVQPAVPADATGYRVRDCSSSSTDPIVVVGTNADYVDNGGGGGGGGSTTTNYDSDGDLLGYVKA